MIDRVMMAIVFVALSNLCFSQISVYQDEDNGHNLLLIEGGGEIVRSRSPYKAEERTDYLFIDLNTKRGIWRDISDVTFKETLSSQQFFNNLFDENYKIRLHGDPAFEIIITRDSVFMRPGTVDREDLQASILFSANEWIKEDEVIAAFNTSDYRLYGILFKSANQYYGCQGSLETNFWDFIAYIYYDGRIYDACLDILDEKGNILEIEERAL